MTNLWQKRKSMICHISVMWFFYSEVNDTWTRSDILSQAQTQLSRIKSVLKQQIETGIINEGDKLPSERELSELFTTTRITIKDALVSLATEGLLYREERRGWYVSPKRIEYNPLSRCHFHQMIREQNRIAQTQLMDVRSEIASGDVAQVLQVDGFTPIHIIERLRYIDGRAVLFVENCIKAGLFSGILQHDLTQSLTGIYQTIFGYFTSRSRFEVIPTAAPAHVAKALNLAQGQAVLKICRVNYNQNGDLMDCEFEYWRPDAVVIRIDSQEEKNRIESGGG